MAKILLFIFALSTALATTPSFANGVSHLQLGQHKPRASMITCDKIPSVCRANPSPGPHCCKRQCVDVATDVLNCGACGTKCRYGETCCRGRCTNVTFDYKNCGRCENRCTKGSFCKYGMCSYA